MDSKESRKQTIEQIANILCKHFKDLIDTPCPYCEATTEILSLPNVVLLSGNEEGLVEIRNPCTNCDYGCDTDEHRKTCVMYQEYNTKLGLLKVQKAFTERNCEDKHKAEIEELLFWLDSNGKLLYKKDGSYSVVFDKEELLAFKQRILEGLKWHIIQGY